MNPFKIPHIKAYFRKNDVHLNNQALKYCVITTQYLEIELDGITACSPLFLNQKIAVFLQGEQHSIIVLYFVLYSAMNVSVQIICKNEQNFTFPLYRKSLQVS